MDRAEALARAQVVLGYQFHDLKLLDMALTHRSYTNERRKRKTLVVNNERLEFLGDSVLQLVVSTYLYENFPEWPEGQLSKIRSTIVCEASLAEVARVMCLGEYIRLGRGEMHNGGRERASILADAFEAATGSIYIDGGIRVVGMFLLKHLKPRLTGVADGNTLMDFKTALQERLQHSDDTVINYALLDVKGPAHSRTFEVQVTASGKALAQGEGRSKKEAEQNAARAALERIVE